MKRYLLCLLALLCGHAAATGAAEPPVVGGLEREGAEKFAGAVLVSELHLRRFIASPSGVKPGTTMPDVFAHLTTNLYFKESAIAAKLKALLERSQHTAP